MDAERTERVRGALEEERLDALVCRLPENLLCLTGFWPLSGISFVLFPREGEPTCVAPDCEEAETRQELTGAALVTYRYGSLSAGDLYAQVGRILGDLSRGRGWRRIGIEGTFESVAPPWNVSEPAVPAGLTAGLLSRLWGERRLSDATAMLNRLRSRKTAREADGLRRSNEIARIGLEAFRDSVAPGKTGVELVAEVEHAVMTRGTGYKGASRVRAFAQVAAGTQETARGWRPMEISSSRALRDGDLALLELGVVADGFWSDRTRVRAAGEPTPRQREVLAAVAAAQEAATRAARRGAVAGEVDAAARTVMNDAGLGNEFLHITGHGTGFRYHEPIPTLAPGGTVVLEEGMVFSVEPGAYSEAFGGLRIEDNVLVTGTGAEVLGPFEKGLSG